MKSLLSLIKKYNGSSLSVKVVLKHFFVRLFKNVQMQGAQDPRNEAYTHVR